jgi:hypothetical protein
MWSFMRGCFVCLSIFGLIGVLGSYTDRVVRVYQ